MLESNVLIILGTTAQVISWCPNDNNIKHHSFDCIKLCKCKNSQKKHDINKYMKPGNGKKNDLGGNV